MPDSRRVEVIINVIGEKYNAGTDELEGKMGSARMMVSVPDWQSVDEVINIIKEVVENTCNDEGRL